MILKIADLIIEVKSRYKYTYDMCFDYLYDGEEAVDFTVFATNEDIEEEYKKTPEFSIDVIENTCIYKNLCTEILKYDAIFIHSAAISVDNVGYIFSANSGTGKTTHMNLWLEKFKNRAFVINGDKPILRKIGNDIKVFGTPWCGKEGLNKNVGVNLTGICILERGEKNIIKKVNLKEALLFIISQTIRPKSLELMSLMYDNISMLLENIPIYKLKCNMEMEACDVSYKAMSEVNK